jgi:hypothetical protein
MRHIMLEPTVGEFVRVDLTNQHSCAIVILETETNQQGV